MNAAHRRAEKPSIGVGTSFGSGLESGSGSGFRSERRTGGAPAPSRGAARACGALIAAGIVFVPALPAQAADPVYDFNFRTVPTGVQSIPFGANASTTSVTAAGERVDFRVSVEYGDLQSEPVEVEYPLEAFRGTIDLSSIADDVDDLDEVFAEMRHTPIAGLKFERVGNTVTFEGEFDPEYDSFEVTFSVVYAPGGDGSFGPSAQFRTRAAGEWDYGPFTKFDIRTIAPNPAPIIAKTVDRTLVTADDPRVAYTIAVTRPEGPPTSGGPVLEGPRPVEVPNALTLEDDLTDVLAESGGVAPTDVTVVRGSGSFAIEDGVLRGSGRYDADGEFLLTFTTPHVGGGDGILTNTACATSPARTTVVQTDPDVPVSNVVYDGTRTIVPVPGATACAPAEAVRIEGFEYPEDPEDPDSPKDPAVTPEDPAVEVPSRPASDPDPDPGSSSVPDRLAKTGTDAGFGATLAGASLAALGGGAVLAAVARGRRAAGRAR